MTATTTITRRLAAELEDLNDEQRKAVLHRGNIVVRAGPGAGKTRTLVAKVGYLLDAVVAQHRGVAAITYTRSAAREVVDRLDQLGIHPGRRLTCGTLHGWCLQAIIRPYGPLVDVLPPERGSVIHDNSDTWINLLQSCLDEAGHNEEAQYAKTAINKLRREIAAFGIEDAGNPTVAAAKLFDQRMHERGLYDFDTMVSQALRIIRLHPQIADLVAARYPWLVIDEYQDLGPVLHALVQQLQATTTITVAAFGDPDQSILTFAGADPRFLNELVDQDGYKNQPLHVNYRCGQAIVAASHAALNEKRDHRADPGREDQGIIDPIAVGGGLDDHAAHVVAKLDELIAVGVPGHQIAILYRGRGPLLTELEKALADSSHEYILEADERIPTGDIADFVRDCTARAIAGPQPVLDVSFNGRSNTRIISQLSGEYKRLRQAANLPDFPGRTVERRLANILNHTFTGDAEDISLEDWVTKLDQALDLTDIGKRGPDERDQDIIAKFREAANKHDLTVEDISAGALRIGKVTLTTYHSAKGREWDFVILPGLVDGIMPGRRWSRTLGRYADPTPDDFAQDRRAFYVGLTRAKKAVVLVYGTYWISTDRWKRRHKNSCGSGISPFAQDILDHLDGS